MNTEAGSSEQGAASLAMAPGERSKPDQRVVEDQMGIELDISKQVNGFRLDAGWQAGRELVALFGRSGAGKTMTLQMIAGLLKPDQGRIRINGETHFDSGARIDRRTRHRRLGYVFQNQALFPHMSVQQNVAYGLAGVRGERLRRGGQERGERVAEMLALFGLEGIEHSLPRDISGGQQQRVALARALIGRPRLLMLDEPFSALDMPARLELRRTIREVQAKFCIPMLLVTHSFAEVREMADRVIVYASGSVAQTGSPAEIEARPASPGVEELMGLE